MENLSQESSVFCCDHAIPKPVFGEVIHFVPANSAPQTLSVWGLVARKARHSTPATHLPNLFLGDSQGRKFA